jgi:hypothetical protein
MTGITSVGAMHGVEHYGTRVLRPGRLGGLLPQ